jgi:predicted CoA-binding protein
MGGDGLDDDGVRAILALRRIAMIGASAKPWRDSNHVMRFLLDRGYDVAPVNPSIAGAALHGRTVVGSLDEAGPLEIVDIFRNSGAAGAAVDDAIRLGAKAVWMQLGVIDHAAAARARAAGLMVAMDRCPVIEDRRLGPFRHPPGRETRD